MKNILKNLILSSTFLVGFLMCAPLAHAAISFDNETAWGGTSGAGLTSVSTTMNISSSATLIVIGGLVVDNNVSTNSISATVGGVAATVVYDYIPTTSTSRKFMYAYLVNPPTGPTVTLKINYTRNASNDITGIAATYINGSTLDSSNSGSTVTAGTSLTEATMVVASNCWVVGVGFSDGSNNNTPTNSTGMTNRGSTAALPADAGMIIGDSNGSVSTGSYSMKITTPSNNSLGLSLASYTLFVAPTAVSPLQDIILFQ